MTEAAGRIVGARIDDAVIRMARDGNVRGGDLLVWEGDDRRHLMQVTSMEHRLQYDMRMETKRLRHEPSRYLLLRAKPLAEVDGDGPPLMPSSIPPMYGPVRMAAARDLSFLPGPGPGRVLLGTVRSGSRAIEGADLHMDAKTLHRHVLVSGMAGAGKSNLAKRLSYNLLDTKGIGALVLDARGEYYPVLSAHPRAASRLVCYTGSPAGDPGQVRLRVNVRSITPHHFLGLAKFGETEEEVMWSLWHDHGEEWVIRLLDESQDWGMTEPHKGALAALRLRMRTDLGIKVGGTFDAGTAGGITIDEIVRRVSRGHVVVLDTSRIGHFAGLMVGAMVADGILQSRWEATKRHELDGLPVATVIIEEAQRLLGSDVIGDGNPFAAIIRDGRKLKVGLMAITRHSSAIPKEILVDMCTKIIMWNGARDERDAIVNSAAQDLSGDHDAIASLDAGEAIVSSAFIPFAVPVKIPRVEDLVGDGRLDSPPAQARAGAEPGAGGNMSDEEPPQPPKAR